MKNRDYKNFRANCYYHIFNRGVNKENIFLNEKDYLNFLKRLKIILNLAPALNLNIKPLPAQAFSMVSYCLMPNHFHFLVRQNSDLGIPKLLLKLCTSYSMYFNKNHSRIGPLFQDTFKAKLVDSDSYAQYVSAYIHNNPPNPLLYSYSSLPDILGNKNGTIVEKSVILSWFNYDSESYKNFVLGFGQNEITKIKDYLFMDEA